jgi:hypothetical protein
VQKIQKRLDRSLSQAEKLETIQEKGRELLADFDAVIETLSKVCNKLYFQVIYL